MPPLIKNHIYRRISRLPTSALCHPDVNTSLICIYDWCLSNHKLCKLTSIFNSLNQKSCLVLQVLTVTRLRLCIANSITEIESTQSCWVHIDAMLTIQFTWSSLHTQICPFLQSIFIKQPRFKLFWTANEPSYSVIKCSSIDNSMAITDKAPNDWLNCATWHVENTSNCLIRQLWFREIRKRAKPGFDY